MSEDKDVKSTDVNDALADPGHLFDQTNGMATGLDGDSDGTAASDEYSSAERNDGDAERDEVSNILTERNPDR